MQVRQGKKQWMKKEKPEEGYKEKGRENRVFTALLA